MTDAGSRLIRAGFLVVAALVASSLIGSAPVSADEGAGFKVIIHAAQEGQAIRRALLADVFFGRVSHWVDGTPIRPADQATRRVRSSFSRKVLALPERSVQSYWDLQVARTRQAAPLVFGSDEEVIAFVSATPGAIGYISSDTPVDGDVRVLSVVG
jgi:ABC-type phosphate transport system substrate-binding protein